MIESSHPITWNSRDFARSHAVDWSPPLSITPELEAHCRLKTEWERHSHKPIALHGRKKQFLVADIDEFEIYYPSNNRYRAYELTCLHFLGASGGMKFCFDGIVRLGDVQYYIQGIPIQDACINLDGYKYFESTQTRAYIQSELSGKDGTYDIWYRLNKPTSRYQRFHDAFLWIAQLSKYVVDYMSKAPRSLICFRSDFHSYLADRVIGNSNFESWHTAFEKKTDFRVAIVAYIDYLFAQANRELSSERLVNQPLWTECMAKAVTPRLRSTKLESTIVTPAVYACFKGKRFGGNLSETHPSRKVQVAQEKRKRNLGFAEIPKPLTYSELSKYCQPYGTSPVMVGDVVAMIPNQKELKTWKSAKREWLAYVQGTETLDNGVQKLFIFWIYRPNDTNIATAFYPLENELFFSDHCNCAEVELLSSQIKGKYPIDWCPSVANADRFFVRQTYKTKDSSFVTLTDEHKICQCRRQNCQSVDTEYRLGHTVYLQPSDNQDLLEPVIIQRIDRKKGSVFVRKLLRLGRDCSELAEKAQRSRIAGNELVFTRDIYEAKISQLQRHCSIRFVSRHDLMNDKIPFPYNRKGEGDFWFISMKLILKDEKEQLVFLQCLPEYISQRVKFESAYKLRGLSLFGGGGLFDRGLEEGGAVEFRTVIDSSVCAMKTQQANIKHPERVCLYCGSVNSYFESALRGDVENIVSVGEVDFIAAGCPCVAFSTLQQNKTSERSLYNASLIGSFCSNVDLFRPLYAVLENVVEISSEGNENLLDQIVAFLVSMGYQVNQTIMDAWSYGSPQSRSRLILTIAAPGLHPIMQQPHTHNLPENQFKSGSIGILPNGKLYGEREYYPTPFHHVPAAAVSSGLPAIGNSIVQTCIPYPDHRVVQLPTWKDRALLERIPKDPPGCGYQEAMDRELIPLHLRSNEDNIGKRFKRMKKHGLAPTIITEAKVSNAHGSAVVHWEEPRSISLLEARRTQGVGDNEPIVGSLREQYKIVGNGVDRRVSFSIGLALLYAQEKNELRFVSNDAADNSAHHIAGDASDAEFVPVPSDKTDSIILASKKHQALEKRTPTFALPNRSRSLEKSEKRRAQNFDSRPHSNKRPYKQSSNSRIGDSARDKGYMATSLPSEGHTAQSSGSSKRTRYTRHSGLEVEFVPKYWNKRVEVVYRNSKL